MKFITDSNDPRFQELSGVWGPAVRSKNKAESDAAIAVAWLMKSVRVALCRAEKAEAALCGGREALKQLKDGRNDIEDMRAVNALSAALSSTAPCPHEEETKLLIDTMVRLLKSSDASWYSGKHGGHNWREAVDEAHLLLVKTDRAALKAAE